MSSKVLENKRKFIRLVFTNCYSFQEEDQCDKFFWVDEPWHPRVQKTLEQKAEEEKMKLELDTADHISELELAYKKN